MVTIAKGEPSAALRRPKAFLLQLTKRGLEGDGAAARESLAMIEQARERQSAGQSRIHAIVMVGVAPGSVTSALEPLRMARKLDRYRETARTALEPWLVEDALARLGRSLSPSPALLRAPSHVVANAASHFMVKSLDFTTRKKRSTTSNPAA
jgi:hypothetical protein